MLRVGGFGLLGLTMPRLLQAGAQQAWSSGSIQQVAPRAKSVIFLYQFGGPSHIDMFDMKPDAPEAIRSPHKPISSNVPGIQVSERLPRVARVMDKVTLIRSVSHTMKNHNSASYYALTGHAPPTDDIRLKDSLDLFPSYGSVVDRLAPSRGDIPTSVAYPYLIRDGSVTPGQRASFLGKAHDPFFFSQDPSSPNFALPELSLPADISIGRLESRRQLQQMIDRQSHLLDHSAAAAGLDEYYAKALAMLNSSRLRNAFNLSAEPDDLRDAYGRHTYGQSLLLARRLVEAEAKFVTVYFSDSIGGQSPTSGGWDTHGFNNTHMYPIVEKYHLPMTDQTLPTLLIDLDRRGLLDTTLVLWMGEFGRTPKIEGQNGRNHFPNAWSTVLAGGGIKGGQVIGKTSADGTTVEERPVSVPDFLATVCLALGINPEKTNPSNVGRPIRIADVGAKPIKEVIA
jgi:hypothetical protein